MIWTVQNHFGPIEEQGIRVSSPDVSANNQFENYIPMLISQFINQLQQVLQIEFVYLLLFFFVKKIMIG